MFGPLFVCFDPKLINAIINEEKMPDEMRIEYTTTIHKNGSKMLCANFGGICVTILKILIKLIKIRLENKTNDTEDQYGFTKGRS